jgi:hypothetical protein
MDNIDDIILTVGDIQRIFHCGKNQAYEIVRLPGFPVMRIGRAYYIYKSAFLKWLEQNKDKELIK